MPFTRPLRRLLVVLALIAGVVAAPSGAFAADCAHQIIDQAYKGKITGTFSQACYNEAIRIEPVDGSSYSDIDSIIKSAKRNAALAARDASVSSTPTVAKTDPVRTVQVVRSNATTTAVTPPPQTSETTPSEAGGGRVNVPDKGTATARATGTPKPAADTPDPTLLGMQSATPVLDHLAPAHADDVPVAVIVLGVLAVLLVLAGAAGAILRRRSSRSSS